MGLDITAYRHIEPLDCRFDHEGNPIDAEGKIIDEDRYVRFYVIPAWKDRAPDIIDRLPYRYAASLCGPACGYLGHSVFREKLAELAGYPPVSDDPYKKLFPRSVNCWGGGEITGGPFWELINFSDCDGVLGAAVCRKLADDFAKHQDAANTLMLDGDWLEHYNAWRECLEFAAAGGCVKFH